MKVKSEKCQRIPIRESSSNNSIVAVIVIDIHPVKPRLNPRVNKRNGYTPDADVEVICDS